MGPLLRVSCSLKAIARVVGLAPVEVDRERIHDLPPAELAAYVASDARLARCSSSAAGPASPAPSINRANLSHPLISVLATGS